MSASAPAQDPTQKAVSISEDGVTQDETAAPALASPPAEESDEAEQRAEPAHTERPGRHGRRQAQAAASAKVGRLAPRAPAPPRPPASLVVEQHLHALPIFVPGPSPADLPFPRRHRSAKPLRRPRTSRAAVNRLKQAAHGALPLGTSLAAVALATTERAGAALDDESDPDSGEEFESSDFDSEDSDDDVRRAKKARREEQEEAERQAQRARFAEGGRGGLGARPGVYAPGAYSQPPPSLRQQPPGVDLRYSAMGGGQQAALYGMHQVSEEGV
ncbi:hypothetical protein QBZ16_001711 [Prototheca wickerhamii]|uniref:Uncharacterized protein n=1 Tax=Prototheca wickerhamii TaxID=3111 RepID=A0AAD9MK26_PROWI|nr:hypothetical protein QBZ16_001711 [Prototheca wickerhamii]